jgi:predicted membrane chloride channel (bestrophin family)
MLLYCNKSHIKIIFCWYGSVFWNKEQFGRALLVACITAFLQYLSSIGSELAPEIPDMFAMNALGVVVGLAAVFRTNLGWARYWEAATQVHFMYSKWGDAYSQIFAFATVTLDRLLAANDEDSHVKVHRVGECLDRLLRNFTFMSAIATDGLAHSDTQRMDHRVNNGVSWQRQIVRREDLTREDLTEATKLPTFIGSMGENEGRHCSMAPETPNDWAQMQYIVKENLKEEELQCLESSSDRPSLIMYWIIHDLAEISTDLVIAPPIQSRMYQELSNGMLALNQAQKIADVPFPFLYAQLLSILIACYSCFIPVYISVLTQSFIAGPILALVLFQGVWCINLIATQMDNPFGNDSNDIPLVDFHDRFLDLCTEVHVGHKVKLAAADQRRRKLEGALQENWRKHFLKSLSTETSMLVSRVMTSATTSEFDKPRASSFGHKRSVTSARDSDEFMDGQSMIQRENCDEFSQPSTAGTGER